MSFWKLDVFLAIALLLFSALFAYAYTKQERFFYFWDYAAYQDIAQTTVDTFRTSRRVGFIGVHESFAKDYNQLFALPLVPVALKFGLSRRIFVVGITVFYLVPLGLLLGAVSSRLFTTPEAKAASATARRRIFWIAAAVTLLLPTVWAPTLRGYPDAGAAALMALATYLYLRAWEKQTATAAGFAAGLGPLLGAGVCVAMAILFRRHFSYAGVAFYGAAVLHQAATALLRRSLPRELLIRLVRAAVGLIGMGIASAVTLLLIGTAFVKNVLTNNYYQLYSSYLNPPAQEAQYFLTHYGVLICLLSLGGWLLGGVRGLFRKPETAFILLYGALALGLWIGVVRQMGPHYMLHITFLVVPGLVALFEFALRLPAFGPRTLAASLLLLVLAVNAVVGLSEPSGFRDRLPPLVRGLTTEPTPPLRRPDRDEMLRLLNRLHALAAPGEPIFPAGSSTIFNADILIHAERAHRPAGAAPLTLLEPPQIDSRDFYPLERLLQARYVVVPNPPQFHLSAEEQDVVGIVNRMFAERWPLVRSGFEPVGDVGPFALQDGVTAMLYKRVRPIPLPAAAQALTAVEKAAAPRPGVQQDWMGASGGEVFPPGPDHPEATSALQLRIPVWERNNKATNERTDAFLYIGDRSGNRRFRQISGTVELYRPVHPGEHVQVSVVEITEDGVGTVREVAETPLLTPDSQRHVQFELTVPADTDDSPSRLALLATYPTPPSTAGTTPSGVEVVGAVLVSTHP